MARYLALFNASSCLTDFTQTLNTQEIFKDLKGELSDCNHNLSGKIVISNNSGLKMARVISYSMENFFGTLVPYNSEMPAIKGSISMANELLNDVTDNSLTMAIIHFPIHEVLKELKFNSKELEPEQVVLIDFEKENILYTSPPLIMAKARD